MSNRCNKWLMHDYLHVYFTVFSCSPICHKQTFSLRWNSFLFVIVVFSSFVLLYFSCWYLCCWTPFVVFATVYKPRGIICYSLGSLCAPHSPSAECFMGLLYESQHGFPPRVEHLPPPAVCFEMPVYNSLFTSVTCFLSGVPAMQMPCPTQTMLLMW